MTSEPTDPPQDDPAQDDTVEAPTTEQPPPRPPRDPDYELIGYIERADPRQRGRR